MTDNEEKLAYYNGFNDGLHACNMTLMTLVTASTELKNVTQLKMLIAQTANTLADIMDNTSKRVEKYLEKVKEEL